MFRIIIMTFSLIAVVLVNAAANIMPINGKTTGEISNSLPVLFTPAGYAFSIWAVIYLLLAIWLYGFMRNKVNVDHALFNRRVVLFVLSCLLKYHLDFALAFRLFRMVNCYHPGTSYNTVDHLFYLFYKG